MIAWGTILFIRNIWCVLSIDQSQMSKTEWREHEQVQFWNSGPGFLENLRWQYCRRCIRTVIYKTGVFLQLPKYSKIKCFQVANKCQKIFLFLSHVLECFSLTKRKIKPTTIFQSIYYGTTWRKNIGFIFRHDFNKYLLNKWSE